MKRFCSALLFLLLLSGTALGAPVTTGYVEGEVLVLLEATSSAADDERTFERALSADADRAAGSVGARTVRTYSSLAAMSGKNIVHMRSDQKSTDQLIEELRGLPSVLGVAPNYIVTKATSPNDPRYSQGDLWGLEQANAPDAWQETTGSRNVIVAIIDTGINYSHPDLIANIARDLDGRWGLNALNGTDDPMDDNGHGTHVAGTVGAVGNNGIGVVGVNWQVGLLAVKVLDSEGVGSDASVIAGLDYVVTQKRKGLDVAVVNLSLTSWREPIDNPMEDPYGVALRAVNDEGILIVAAAGNEHQNIDNPGGIDSDPDNPRRDYRGKRVYPACLPFPNLIAVAAIGSDGQRPSFSNYSPTYIALAAPGVDILSTTHDGGYERMTGTSMAAPHVAGAAALLKAAFPEETAPQIKERILSGVSANRDLVGLVATGGHLNIGAALNVKGSLRALIDGPANARWQIDGKGSYVSGQTVTTVPVGNRVVSFSPVSGWTTPANQTVTVERGRTTTVDVSYTPGGDSYGSVQVHIDGPYWARWSIDGAGSYSSGEIVRNVPVGDRRLSFSYVPGWRTPFDQYITVRKDMTARRSVSYDNTDGLYDDTFGCNAAGSPSALLLLAPLLWLALKR